MLQSIRDHTQGWIAGIIISLLIVSFALWGIHSYFGGAAENPVVAKVNGTEVTKSQLTMTYERMRRQLQAQYSSSYTLPEGAEAGLKQQALQTLIDIQVLLQASIKQDYRISSRQIDNYLESMPEFQVNGHFSLERFEQLLATTMFTANDFLNLIKTSLLIDQPRLGLLLTSFSLPDEVMQGIALVNQEREISYAKLLTQTFLKRQIEISEDKILDYYNSHQGEFQTPEQASIDYVELSAKEIANSFHPTDQILKSFYDENSNAYTHPGQWKLIAVFIPLTKDATAEQLTEAHDRISDIAKKISQGDDFATWAQQYPANKKLEELQQGWVTLNKVPAELQKAVLSLTKENAVVGPARFVDGFVLLKATDFKEAEVQPYSQVKDKVKETYIHQMAEEKFADLKEKLANIAYEHPDSLLPAAKLLGIPVKSTELFTKVKGGKDLSSNNKIREAAFSNDVLNLQNNSDVIQLNNDTALVLHIKTHVPATLLSLKAVENQIKDKLKAVAADEMTANLAGEIKQALTEGTTLEQIARKYDLTWNDVGFIGRHSTKVDSAILNAAFDIPRPKNNVSYAIVKTQGGYAVIALKAVKDGTVLDKASDQYRIFAEQIQNTQGLLEYELYKQSLFSRAKIVVEK